MALALPQTLKLAARVLLRRKFFTAASLFGVAFTLLVLTVAAAMLDSALAPRAPETRLQRTLTVFSVRLEGGAPKDHPDQPTTIYTGFPGYALLAPVLRDLPGAEATSLVRLQHTVVSYVGGRRIESWLKGTDAAYWRILDFDFVEGGPYGEAAARDGQRVAVINETTRRRFFGDAPALGRALEADGQRFTVVGVVRDVPFVRQLGFADVWVPFTTARRSGWQHETRGNFVGMVLARDAAAMPGIRAEVRSRLARFPLAGSEYDRVVGGADTLFEAYARLLGNGESADPTAAAHRVATVLLVLALLFMALPAVNLVNVNLSRILERASEIGVRRAFGAPVSALVLQFLAENLFLTLLGGLLGFVASAAVLGWLNGSGIVPYAEFGLNLRVFLWGLAAALVFGVLSGVYPAWRMARMHPVQALRGRS